MNAKKYKILKSFRVRAYQKHPHLRISLNKTSNQQKKTIALPDIAQMKPLVEKNMQKRINKFTEKALKIWWLDRNGIDGKAINDKKHLARGYRLFFDNHVENLLATENANGFYINATCRAEQYKKKTYTIWLVLNKNGEKITHAICNCDFSRGDEQNATCKHVSAVAYNVEHAVKNGSTHASPSCTSLPQQWGRPPSNHSLSPMPAWQVEYVNAEFGKQGKKSICSIDPYDPRPPHMQTTTRSEIDTLLNGLKKIDTDCALLQVAQLEPLNRKIAESEQID